jgi:uncharacterized membrane protein
MKDNHLRSLIKGISWRITGTIDTITISFIITGNAFSALKIGGIEVITKILLYYFHERIWAKIDWGRHHHENGKEKHSRSLVKGISWRTLGTIDTMIISFFVTGSIFTALQIGAVEVITKIILYYFHERIWALIKWGKVPIETVQNVEQFELKEI